MIASDRYFKRDDVGIVYQMNVVPGAQRGLIGATLLKAVFDRAAYGCKLFCCWCAQDIAANRFWESLGFVPLAFRAGGRGRAKRHEGDDAAAGFHSVPPSLRASVPAARVHIFWQRRVRAGDTTTPWWFPSQTLGGAIREDRLVLPVPPGVRWEDVRAVVLPGEELPVVSGQLPVGEKPKALPGGRRRVRRLRPSRWSRGGSAGGGSPPRRRPSRPSPRRR